MRHHTQKWLFLRIMPTLFHQKLRSKVAWGKGIEICVGFHQESGLLFYQHDG
jgi:hypothetical protein